MSHNQQPGLHPNMIQQRSESVMSRQDAWPMPSGPMYGSDYAAAQPPHASIFQRVREIRELAMSRQDQMSRRPNYPAAQPSLPGGFKRSIEHMNPPSSGSRNTQALPPPPKRAKTSPSPR